MTAYSTGEARDALAGLVGTGAAVPLDDPVLVGQVVDGARQAYADVCKERDELLERIHAARQTLFPLKHDRGLLGQLARTVDAELAASPEQEATA